MNDSIGIIGAEDAVAGAMGTAIGILVVFYFLILFFAFAIGIASYVLSSLGLYTIADRRGIRNAWLAWVPIGNTWLLGSISDQYQYVTKGKVTNRRKILLALNIGLVAVYIGWIIAMIGAMFSEMIGATLLFIVLGWLLFMAVWVTICVFLYMSYYDLFRSCQPSNAVLYLVLSILISVTLPFFVFFCRKKDLGMPPRKQPAPQPVAVPTVEPVADPTVVEKVAVPTVEPVVDPTVVEKVTIPTVEPIAEAPAEAPPAGVDAFSDPSATEKPAEKTTEE